MSSHVWLSTMLRISSSMASHKPFTAFASLYDAGSSATSRHKGCSSSSMSRT